MVFGLEEFSGSLFPGEQIHVRKTWLGTYLPIFGMSPKEVATFRLELKQKLARCEDLTLVELEQAARQSCDFFKSFQDRTGEL